MIGDIFSWIISIFPKLLIVFLVIYVMKMVYDYGEKRWREGFSTSNNHCSCGRRMEEECNCI
tara:strand:+ start:462 stop:647 length:186 start_codon:yes stop_codon:yes gene_type:complete